MCLLFLFLPLVMWVKFCRKRITTKCKLGGLHAHVHEGESITDDRWRLPACFNTFIVTCHSCGHKFWIGRFLNVNQLIVKLYWYIMILVREKTESQPIRLATIVGWAGKVDTGLWGSVVRACYFFFFPWWCEWFFVEKELLQNGKLGGLAGHVHEVRASQMTDRWRLPACLAKAGPLAWIEKRSLSDALG